jgi:site-specific recombinase XerD
MQATPPLPLFDSIKYINEAQDYSYLTDDYCMPDIKQAHQFLLSYTGSQGTFNSYRREIERLIHWCALVASKKLSELRRHDIEEFIEFCKQPTKSWIGTQKPPRFISKEGKRQPNPNWRAFVVQIPKSAHAKGLSPQVENFELSGGAIREVFAILSSFYNYLIQEEYLFLNPVALVRQKSKFLRKTAQPKIRRLSELQWEYVVEVASEMATKSPDKHERSLFIMSALYGMYLRISELADSERWTPTMNDFARDSDGNWWFTTVGKGNKERRIAVSNAMLNALKRWRKFLGLSALPAPSDNSPILPKNRGSGAIKSMNFIRDIVQTCFDNAVQKIQLDGLSDEAETLQEATVHWLRHTGISDDVKRRPREHVRDDAGHSSSAITDKYIDIELRERHKSAINKEISSENK